MLAFILANDNLPYVVCTSVVLMLVLVEAMARLAGGSLLALMDEPPVTSDISAAHNSDANNAATSLSTLLTTWLGLERMPVLLWFVCALACFAASGFLLNLCWLLFAEELLPQGLSVWPAFVLTTIGCHLLAQRFRWQITVDEENDNLSGTIAIMTLGRAQKGIPGEALVRDEQQQMHYVLVEPREDGMAFEAGNRVLLLQRQGMIWQATRLET